MQMLKSAIVVLVMLSIGVTTAMAEQVQDLPQEEATAPGADTRNEAYLNLLNGRYADLQRDYTAYLDAYLAGKMSEEAVAAKFAIFSNAPGLESRFDGWVNTHPSSYAARLARGLARTHAAWLLRGSKFAADTTNDQVKGFLGGLDQATTDLKASLTLHAKPIWSYTALIQVERGRGADAAAVRGLLDAALKIDPTAYGPRMEYQIFLTPKWGGSVGQMEAFLRQFHQSSALSQQNKARLASSHHLYLGSQAQQEKDYKAAAEEFFQAYRDDSKPNLLLRSGQAALDGSLYELAFQRFDALVKAHPTYAQGYNKRGWLYESQFKDDEKAFKDYLAAARLGNSYAQNRVGWWYMTGKLVDKDLNQAEAYFQRAAEQNNSTAMANLRSLNKLRKSAD